MRRTLPLLLLFVALPALGQDLELELNALYKAKKWAQVVARADAGPAGGETEFLAARALRNMDRHEEARARYQKLIRSYPDHARVPDASIEAALMLVSDLDQVAHGKAELKRAVRAARELEAVATKAGVPVPSVARASYIGGNTWRIALRDAEAKTAYERAIATGHAAYTAKSLDKLGELAFRGLDAEQAGAYWRECLQSHGKTAAGRSSQRALSRQALAGKPAPDFEVELWAQGEPVEHSDLVGKVTLVYAFTVWCPHCKRELPHAADLLDDYGERGFQVVGLTKNGAKQTTAQVFPFIEDPQYKISYPVAVDLETRTTEAWGLTGLPSAALVDRKGVVRWVGHPNFLSTSSIETLLDEEAPKG